MSFRNAKVGLAVLIAGLLASGGVVAFKHLGARGSPKAVVTVRLAGRTFRVELATEPAVQDKGLGDRDHIDADGGMLFVFAEPEWQEFVMRDCRVAIDLLYLDDSGLVESLHAMAPERARGENERADTPAQDFAYNARLARYPSSAKTRLVLELRGGTVRALGVRPGAWVDLRDLPPELRSPKGSH